MLPIVGQGPGAAPDLHTKADAPESQILSSREARQQRAVYLERALDGQWPAYAPAPPARPRPYVVADAMAHIAEQSTPLPQLAVPEMAPTALRILHRVGLGGRRAYARLIYRPSLDTARNVASHVGAFGNAYTGHSPEEFARKWKALEQVHRKSKFGGAWGHNVGNGAPLVVTKLIATRGVVQDAIRLQEKEIGRDLILPDGTFIPIKKATMGLMLGVSGMSFPQLSAPSVLSLCYTNVKLAKHGVRFMMNTGEGGPDLHLAFMSGDAEGLRRHVIAWGQKTGEIPPGSSRHAKVEEYVARLMKERNELFAEFTPEDLAKAQIVAQFGSALNGIHDEQGGINFPALRKIGENPFVAMTEFKIKQAAKPGAKVDASKMDDLAAANRHLIPGHVAKAPVLHPEFGSYEDIAALIIAAKLETRKPVSIKFAVGDVDNIYEFLEYLRDAGALPDHIQIDGAGKYISPGSGNAPPTGTDGDGNLGMRDGVIAVDTVLKHLGVRDLVHVAAAGEVMLPSDGVETMQLGADSIMGARTWLGMGLGCAKVGACDTGNCPYGIASRGGSVFADSLDPRTVGPKAAAAALEWHEHLVNGVMKTGAMDWRLVHKTHGLHAWHVSMRIAQDDERPSLQKKYGRERIHDLLQTIMRHEEIDEAVYRYRPAEYVDYERFDAKRRLLQYLGNRITRDPARFADIDAFLDLRLRELEDYVVTPRSGPDIRDFVRANIPDDLWAPGMGPHADYEWKHPQLRALADSTK